MDKTIADIQAEARRLLSGLYNQRELQQIVFELLACVGFSHVQVIACPDAKLSETDYQRLSGQLKRLAESEP